MKERSTWPISTIGLLPPGKDANRQSSYNIASDSFNGLNPTKDNLNCKILIN